MATRREKVILELQDDFTSGMARAAAAAAILDKNLDHLSGRAVSTDRNVRNLGDSTDRLDTSTRRGGDSINQFSGRLALMAQAAAALGPALVPIGAVAVPAITSLSAGLASAAGAVGVALLAFNGMGDALKALDAYQLEPTTANLDKMRAALDELGPAGADFARFFDGLDDQFQSLQDIASAGLFPGLEQGIRDLLPLLPQVQRIVAEIAESMGDLSVEAAGALNNERFRAFFDYLETDAAPTLKDFASATGNVLEGLASLTVAFAPLTRGFTAGMQEMSASFADWAANVSQTDGFQNFIDYIRASGPQVLATLGSLADMFIQIATAAAPIGGPVLQALEAIADAVAAIASSDIGTPLVAAAVAMTTFSRAAALSRVAMNSTWGTRQVGSIKASAAALVTVTSAQDRARMSAQALAVAERERAAAVRSGVATMAKSAAAIGGLALVSSGAADSFGMTNTASLALMGTFAGPWGAAVGAGIGLTMDLASANNDLEDAIRGADAAMDSMDPAQLQASLDVLNAQLDATNDKLTINQSLNPFKSSAEVATGVVSGLHELFTGTKKAAEAKRDDVEATLEATHANGFFANAVATSARNVRLAASQVAGLTTAMEENRRTALSSFDAITAYSAALDAARKRAKESSAGLSATTEDGRKNRDALSDLAAAWNNQGDAIRNNVAKWRDARRNFIETAVAMGVPIKKARELANRLMEIPEKRVIAIDARTDAAKRNLLDLKGALDAIRPKTITVTVLRKGTSVVEPHADIPGPGHGAEGTTVPKTGLPYADRHLYLLADGEEVISNRHGQADRFRADRASGRIPGYADGGTIPGYADGGKVRSTSVVRALVNLSDVREAGRELKALAAASRRTSRALDDETKKRDALTARRDDLRTSIKQGLRSDIFATPEANNPWTSSKPAVADPIGALKADNTQIREFMADIKTLRAKKVTGAALAEALGNPEYAAMLADMSAADLRSYTALYGERERLLNSAATSGASATGYAQAAAAQTEVVRELTLQNRAQTRAVAAQTRELAAIKDELKKIRGDATSAARNRR